VQVLLDSSICRILKAKLWGHFIVGLHLLVVCRGVQDLTRLSAMLKMVQSCWKSRLWNKVRWYKPIDCNIIWLHHWKTFALGDAWL